METLRIDGRPTFTSCAMMDEKVQLVSWMICQLEEVNEIWRSIRERDLRMVFIDLEKTYDRMLREVLWKALEKVYVLQILR